MQQRSDPDVLAAVLWAMFVSSVSLNYVRSRSLAEAFLLAALIAPFHVGIYFWLRRKD